MGTGPVRSGRPAIRPAVPAPATPETAPAARTPAPAGPAAPTAPAAPAAPTATTESRAEAAVRHAADPRASALRAGVEGAATPATASAGCATVSEALATPARDVTVHGRTFHIHGADERQAAIIERSLERVPADHIHTIPETFAVADTIGGGRTSGGNTVIHGNDRDHIEISTRSLSESGDPARPGYRPITEDGVSRTVLHECGHAVTHAGEHGGLSWRTRDALSTISAAGPESRMAEERFAQGYMYYVLGDTDPRGVRGLTDAQRTSMERAFTHIRPE